MLVNNYCNVQLYNLPLVFVSRVFRLFGFFQMMLPIGLPIHAGSSILPRLYRKKTTNPVSCADFTNCPIQSVAVPAGTTAGQQDVGAGRAEG